MENVEVVDLNHYALLSYLRSRGISEEVGRTYCKEIHYELRKRHYFAIAFENVKGGYEVRNPYYKDVSKARTYPSSGTTGMSSKDTSAFLRGLWISSLI